jgi:hypothetical protein
VTPQQHKQHLLALAARLNCTTRSDFDCFDAATELRNIAARLTPGDEDKWQPIETAPEGEILVYMPEERFKIQAANWGSRVRTIGGVFDFDRTKPTHWQPLPSAPADAAVAAPPKEKT